VRFRLAADVILATFFVSHLTPFGSARDGAAWLTAFRTLIFCRTRCVPRVAKHFADRGWAAYPTLKPMAR
jgi:hypothetical protein